MSYQAIYDAVRSQIRGGDIGSAIRDVASNAFDISWQVEQIKQEFIAAGQELQRPSVIYRPTLSQDGDSWCAALGSDLRGLGASPAEAMAAFDTAFYAKGQPK